MLDNKKKKDFFWGSLLVPSETGAIMENTKGETNGNWEALGEDKPDGRGQKHAGKILTTGAARAIMD